MENKPKVTAKRSRKVSSVMSAVVAQNAKNAKIRVKQFDTSDGFIAHVENVSNGILEMPLELANANAFVRREWCLENGVEAIRAYDDAYTSRRAVYMPMNNNGWRPESTIRQRLMSLKKVGITNLHYVRCETNPVQYAMAISLDWSNGEPETFGGADLVFIYKISDK